jgi:hypothetical protein
VCERVCGRGGACELSHGQGRFFLEGARSIAFTWGVGMQHLEGARSKEREMLVGWIKALEALNNLHLHHHVKHLFRGIVAILADHDADLRHEALQVLYPTPHTPYPIPHTRNPITHTRNPKPNSKPRRCLGACWRR